MRKKDSPKATGISDITGKIVRIRHANEPDMVFIEEKMKQYKLDTENLHYSEFVIATENGDIVGFGRLKKTEDIYEIGCVVVFEGRRGRGIGPLIVKHLIDYAPVKKVYTVTDKTDYFKGLGFVKIREGAKGLEALDKACRIKGGNTVLMSYKKSAV